MNKKAFTLVELLAVIVILGIIIAIVVPTVNLVVSNQEFKKYGYHIDVVDEALDVYVDQNKSIFEEDNGLTLSTCFNIPYQTLLDLELVMEEDIKCTGFIQATRLTQNQSEFEYKYYLKCTNAKGDVVSNDIDKLPPGCDDTKEALYIEDLILRYNDKNGETYPQGEDNWTNQNVYVEIDINDPHMVGMDKGQYSTDGGNTWIDMKDKYGNPTNNFTESKEQNREILVRGVDNLGNTTPPKKVIIRIDKTAPRGRVVPIGTMGNNNWYISDITFETRDVLDPVSNGVRSGIRRVEVTPTRIYWDTQYTNVDLIIYDKAGNKAVISEANGTRIQVRRDVTPPSAPSASMTKPEGWQNVPSNQNTAKVRINDAYGSNDGTSGLDHYEYLLVTKYYKDSYTIPNSAAAPRHCPAGTRCAPYGLANENSFRERFVDKCGYTYYAYVIAVDKAGNATAATQTDSHKIVSCCSAPGNAGGNCSSAGYSCYCDNKTYNCKYIPNQCNGSSYWSQYGSWGCSGGTHYQTLNCNGGSCGVSVNSGQYPGHSGDGPRTTYCFVMSGNTINDYRHYDRAAYPGHGATCTSSNFVAAHNEWEVTNGETVGTMCPVR